MDNVVSANRIDSYASVLLEGMDGEKTIRYSEYPNSESHSVVRADLGNPESLMHHFDACLDERRYYPHQTTFGLIGKQIVEIEDGSDKQFDFAVAPDGLTQDDYCYKDAPPSFPVHLIADSWNSIVTVRTSHVKKQSWKNGAPIS